MTDVSLLAEPQQPKFFSLLHEKLDPPASRLCDSLAVLKKVLKTGMMASPQQCGRLKRACLSSVNARQTSH